ncbi:MAG: hypothetical protein F6K40_19190 [Okeania sp. SIO3I5]|uniref:hypothetical protein n=1 Tax=Okeania sp. SIO3I5 TaxID=2607805 RepID=UPI0013BD6636|nr:hypothetical protein [Okeania sp. SIO3I5]NEQ38270.1 hypothetical protein [Okeania sp. SIO3I5]
MSNKFNFWEFLWDFLVEIILEKFVIDCLLKTKTGRRFLIFSFTCFLPLLIPHILDYLFEPKDNEISRQEAIDGLTRQCVAQESHYLKNGRMYNKTNDFKDEGKYYLIGLIKYGQNDRIAPIYAEPKEPTLSTFVGLAVMSNQDKFSCLICRSSVHHSIDWSKDFPVINGNSVDCPKGYNKYKRVDF